MRGGLAEARRIGGVAQKEIMVRFTRPFGLTRFRRSTTNLSQHRSRLLNPSHLEHQNAGPQL
jgi:hypothetical protein